MPWKSDLEQHVARGRRLAEHEAESEPAERVEEGHDRHREEGRVRPVAARRLAVAADPVADQREQERAEPERLERRRVDDQPGEEPGAGADDRAAQQRDRDDA